MPDSLRTVEADVSKPMQAGDILYVPRGTGVTPHPEQTGVVTGQISQPAAAPAAVPPGGVTRSVITPAPPNRPMPRQAGAAQYQEPAEPEPRAAEPPHPLDSVKALFDEWANSGGSGDLEEFIQYFTQLMKNPLSPAPNIEVPMPPAAQTAPSLPFEEYRPTQRSSGGVLPFEPEEPQRIPGAIF